MIMTMQAAIEDVKARSAWRSNPYFRALAEGTFDKADFVETQLQFFFAVVFFSRPMAVLAARLPRNELRMNIIRNVHEEHGEGDLRGSHEATFVQLLGKLGITPADIDARALWPEVRSFNTTLTGLAVMDDVPTGLAAMGMIEDLFAGISALLGQEIARNGWLPLSEIVHYATHERLDVRHSAEFYEVLEPAWDHPQTRYAITQGLELGAYIFLRLYRDLYEARTRRALRDIRGAHSASDGWFVPNVA